MEPNIRYISTKKSRSSTFQNPASYRTFELTSYLNHMWDLSNAELQEFLYKNLVNFSTLLRRNLNMDEILNTLFMLLRISKVDMDQKMKCFVFKEILSTFASSLSIFIIHLPLLLERKQNHSKMETTLERFWLSLFQFIQEIIMLEEPLHKKYILIIFFSYRNLVADTDNLKKFKLLKTPNCLLSINRYLNLSYDIKTLRICPSYEEIENCRENVALKSIGDYHSSKGYLLHQYLLNKNNFNIVLSKSIKQLSNNMKSNENNVDFRMFRDCTFKRLQDGNFIVELDNIQRESIKNEEIKNGSLLCCSDDNFETYFFTESVRYNETKNELVVSLMDHVPNLEEKLFCCAEYLKVFYRAFEGLLQSLQMSFFQTLPMEEYIIFGKTQCVSHPKYLQANSECSLYGFRFKLLCGNDWPPKEIFNLDVDQYATLQYILMHELALLKGYPGTGKTRVIVKAVEILLNNEELWKLNDGGPIIILAYTNRSLDNFIEQLIPLTNSIIRFGTQLVNESLKSFTLKLKSNPYSSAIFKKIRTVNEEIYKTNTIIESLLSNSGIVRVFYLEISEFNDYDFYNLLIGTKDEEYRKTLIEEFEDLGSKQKTEIKCSTSEIYYQTVESLSKIGDSDEDYLTWRLIHKNAHKQFYPKDDNESLTLGSLTGNELWGFYFHLIEKSLDKLKLKIKLLKEQNDFLRRTAYEQMLIYNASSVKSSKIVGLTVNGAQFRKPLLNELNSSIVILEETSEIKHYNILSTIPSSCKHLIVISDDHPNITIAPSEKMNDYSLIDILSHHNFPGRLLKRQYRMRPEISFIIRNLFYPDLIDCPNAREILDVPGMPKKFFFIKHNIETDESEQRKWKRGICLYEIEILMQLAKFLVFKGVKPKSITILTHTKYQAKEFNKMKENDESLQEIYCWQIDKFQSLENDIILMSLKGLDEMFYHAFIQTKNRMGIAFSRAKRGMYLIGNIDNFCKNDPTIWSPIKEFLEENGFIGKALPVSCDSHKGKTCAFIENRNDYLNINDQLLTCSSEKLSK